MPDVITFHHLRGLIIPQIIFKVPTKFIIDSNLDSRFKSRLAEESKKNIKILEKYGYCDKEYIIPSKENFFILLDLLPKEKRLQCEVQPLQVVSIKHNRKISNFVKENPELSMRKIRYLDEVFFLQIDIRVSIY